MGLLDIGIMGLILVPALTGAIYGFLSIILSIIAWVLALAISIKFSSSFSPMLEYYVENELFRDAIAFIGLFILCLVLFTGVGYLINRLLGRTGLSAVDRILGLLFGIGLGGSFITVFIFLAGFTDVTQAPWWQRSLLVGPFERTAVWARQFLPENIAKYHNFDNQESKLDSVNN